MTTLTYSGELIVLTCWCGTRHAVPRELREWQMRQFNDGHKPPSLFCPLGHQYVPTGTPKAEHEEQARLAAEAQARHLRDQLEASERSNAALRGSLTRTRKRVQNGVCPCCKRTFANVARHMATKHPDPVVRAR